MSDLRGEGLANPRAAEDSGSAPHLLLILESTVQGEYRLSQALTRSGFRYAQVGLAGLLRTANVMSSVAVA